MTIVFFAIQNRRKARTFFISTCVAAFVETAILLIVYFSFKSNTSTYIDAAISATMNIFLDIDAGFWLTFILSVGGIIFVLVMKSKDREQLHYFEQRPAFDSIPRAPKKFALSVVSGEYMGTSIPIPDEGIYIGRDPGEASLILSGSDISRKHCFIGYNANRTGLSVVDYSSNGTFLDRSTRLLKGMKYDLYAGQKLYLGSKKQVFEVKVL